MSISIDELLKDPLFRCRALSNFDDTSIARKSMEIDSITLYPSGSLENFVSLLINAIKDEKNSIDSIILIAMDDGIKNIISNENHLLIETLFTHLYHFSIKRNWCSMTLLYDSYSEDVHLRLRNDAQFEVVEEKLIILTSLLIEKFKPLFIDELPTFSPLQLYCSYLDLQRNDSLSCTPQKCFSQQVLAPCLFFPCKSLLLKVAFAFQKSYLSTKSSVSFQDDDHPFKTFLEALLNVAIVTNEPELACEAISAYEYFHVFPSATSVGYYDSFLTGLLKQKTPGWGLSKLAYRWLSSHANDKSIWVRAVKLSRFIDRLDVANALITHLKNSIIDSSQSQLSHYDLILNDFRTISLQSMDERLFINGWGREIKLSSSAWDDKWMIESECEEEQVRARIVRSGCNYIPSCCVQSESSITDDIFLVGELVSDETLIEDIFKQREKLMYDNYEVLKWAIRRIRLGLKISCSVQSYFQDKWALSMKKIVCKTIQVIWETMKGNHSRFSDSFHEWLDLIFDERMQQSNVRSMAGGTIQIINRDVQSGLEEIINFRCPRQKKFWIGCKDLPEEMRELLTTFCKNDHAKNEECNIYEAFKTEIKMFSVLVGRDSDVVAEYDDDEDDESSSRGYDQRTDSASEDFHQLAAACF